MDIAEIHLCVPFGAGIHLCVPLGVVCYVFIFCIGALHLGIAVINDALSQTLLLKDINHSFLVGLRGALGVANLWLRSLALQQVR